MTDIRQTDPHNCYEIEADIHTHTIASGHAYGTIREMAQAASEKGLKALGLSEHGPIVRGAFDPIYFLNLSVVPRVLYGVEILHGCEADVLIDGSLNIPQDVIGCIDYVIAGMHGPHYVDQGRRKNTENVISCMKKDYVYFVSHPDNDRFPLDYEELVPAAKEYHVALEVNNSSFTKPHVRLNCVDNYRTMLPLCERYQVPVIVSSDAHDPSWVGQIDLAQDLLKEINFDSSLILNADLQRLKEFIHYS